MNGPNDYSQTHGSPNFEALAASFDVTPIEVIASTNMGIVVHVERRNGQPAVLKCFSKVGRKEEGTSALALSAFGSQAAVRLISATDDAILMEYCTGPKLSEAPDGLNDDIAIPIICSVQNRLHSKTNRIPDSVPSLAQRCEALTHGMTVATDPHTHELLSHARETSADLLASQVDTALLHGDFHHANIMLARRQEAEVWVTIDPQAIAGELAYDVANIFSNPINREDIVLDRKRPARLADTFSAELGLDPTRTLKWGMVHACISAAWSLQDKTDPSFRLAAATLISAQF